MSPVRQVAPDGRGRPGRAVRCPGCRASVVVPAPAAEQPLAGPPSVPQSPADETPLLSAAAILGTVPGRKQSFEDLVDMTAMVDIVFFLLVFFMVTSMQGICASIAMPTPDPQTATTAPRAVTDFENDHDFLILRIDGDDSIWLDDAEIPSEQDLLAKLREAVKDPDGPDRMLVLGNGDAHHATVVRVLDAGAAAGIDDIRLAIDQEQ